jgi:hypothetical protein
MKFFKGCLGIIGAVVVVIIIIAVATSLGGGDKGSSNSADSGSSPSDTAGTSPTHAAKAKPTKTQAPKPKESGPPQLNADAGVANKVKEGKPYVLGDFKIHKGWDVHPLGYGMGYEVKHLVVENLTDSSHTFSVEIKLHKGAHRIVADMQCIANEANPQDIVDVDCLPDGNSGSFDSITIENSF